MTCKRPYTVSSQIQHGNDQEKYVQLSTAVEKKCQHIREKAKVMKANDNTALQ